MARSPGSAAQLFGDVLGHLVFADEHIDPHLCGEQSLLAGIQVVDQYDNDRLWAGEAQLSSAPVRRSDHFCGVSEGTMNPPGRNHAFTPERVQTV